jgi:uncharacterized protein (DUF2461 family)
MSWSDAPPNWNTPIGEKIDRFLQAVAERFPDYADTIVVFGSSTIHLRLDPSFTSADADLRVSTEDILPFKALTEELGMGKKGKEEGLFYLDITPPSAFRSTEVWHDRAHRETRHGLKIMMPQVRDALVGKLHRRRKPEINGLEPKDLRAFLRVQELSGGHPTEAELVKDILLCPYAWHLQLSGTVTDFRLNLEDLWPILYHKPLNVKEQIIRPLLHELELSGYTESRDWHELVRALTPLRR